MGWGQTVGTFSWDEHSVNGSVPRMTRCAGQRGLGVEPPPAPPCQPRPPTPPPVGCWTLLRANPERGQDTDRLLMS